MQNLSPGELVIDPVFQWAARYVEHAYEELNALAEDRTQAVLPLLEKVLNAFHEERLCTQHFASVSGYGHGDQGREVLDRVFAKVLGAEKAIARLQFVSGTHAIAAALFGVLRPHDRLLAVTGRPYDTLEEVIGLRGAGQGSLTDFGVRYDEVPLQENGDLNFRALETALEDPVQLAFIQRSCGYSWRPSLSINKIKKVCDFIHKKQPQAICFVDNCYGEFVEEKEPCEVGADLIAGSLIKNLGGTIVPTGGYVAGLAHLVDKASCRLTSPGIGSDGGTGFDLNRTVMQGLFLAPQMVSEALIGADLIASVFVGLGFEVNPRPLSIRGDVIQSVRFNNLEALALVCRAFQASSPVGSFLDPVPASMPGYESELIMAGGTFIDGSTSEFSADAPLKAPYNIYIQGGTHRAHIKISLARALFELVKAGFLDAPLSC